MVITAKLANKTCLKDPYKQLFEIWKLQKHFPVCLFSSPCPQFLDSPTYFIFIAAYLMHPFSITSSFSPLSSSWLFFFSCFLLIPALYYPFSNSTTACSCFLNQILNAAIIHISFATVQLLWNNPIPNVCYYIDSFNSKQLRYFFNYKEITKK